MMLLVHTQHLKPSGQIQRKTWPSDQVPNDTIDQNSAKSLNKTKYPILKESQNPTIRLPAFDLDNFTMSPAKI